VLGCLAYTVFKREGAISHPLLQSVIGMDVKNIFTAAAGYVEENKKTVAIAAGATSAALVCYPLCYGP
jgi:hypothetical protein